VSCEEVLAGLRNGTVHDRDRGERLERLLADAVRQIERTFGHRHVAPVNTCPRFIRGRGATRTRRTHRVRRARSASRAGPSDEPGLATPLPLGVVA
jgi:hypothetical protein